MIKNEVQILTPVIKEISSRDITPDFLEKIEDIGNVAIEVIFSDEDELEYYHKVSLLIHRLKELNLSNSISMTINRLKILNDSPFYAIQYYSNIHIKYKSWFYSKAEWIELRDWLTDFLKDIIILNRQKGLSPFEIYLAVYNKCKYYKRYRANEDKDASIFSGRSLKNVVFDNQYINCCGFSEILVVALDYFGIPSCPVGIMYEKGGHSRVLVKLEDDKYHIQGIYLSDPTFANDFYQDILNYCLMTFEETTIEIGTQTNTLIDFVFNVHSKEEFIYKINRLLHHLKYLYFDYNLYAICQEYLYGNLAIINPYFTICNDILYYIKKLDYEYYLILRKKYPNMDNNEDTCIAFLDEIGDYIVKLTNKYIPKILIYEASTKIKILMQNTSYSDWEYTKELDKVVKENEEHYASRFNGFWPYEYQLGKLIRK